MKMTRKDFLKKSAITIGALTGLKLFRPKKAHAFTGDGGEQCAIIFGSDDQYGFDKSACIADEGCRSCIDGCPVGLFTLVTVNGKEVACMSNPAPCLNCDVCLDNCPTDAIYDLS